MVLLMLIKVYDGAYIEDGLIGTYCGTERPAPITSKSNQLYVLFHTNTRGVGTGFEAVYGQSGNIYSLF